MIRSVSPSGRPARTPRTMMSSAVGSTSMKLLMRRCLIRASTKCGPPTAIVTAIEPGEQRALDLEKDQTRQRQADRQRRSSGTGCA